MVESTNRGRHASFLLYSGPLCRCCSERLRSGEVSANIEDVEAWIYFTGRVVNVSSEETSLSVRFAYKGEHVIVVRTYVVAAYIESEFPIAFESACCTR